MKPECNRFKLWRKSILKYSLIVMMITGIIFWLKHACKHRQALRFLTGVYRLIKPYERIAA